MCKMHFEIHREPQSHAELTVHAQTHSQPESISVHNAHSLDELTSAVTSIGTAHTLIYHRHFLPPHLCVWVWVCVWIIWLDTNPNLRKRAERKKEEEEEALVREGGQYLPQSWWIVALELKLNVALFLLPSSDMRPPRKPLSK